MMPRRSLSSVANQGRSLPPCLRVFVVVVVVAARVLRASFSVPDAVVTAVVLAQAAQTAHGLAARARSVGLVRHFVDPSTLARPADQSDHVTPRIHAALYKVTHACDGAWL